MMNPLIVVLCFLVLLVGMHFVLRLIWSYRIKNGAFEIVLFRVLPVYRLPLEDIELVRAGHPNGWLIFRTLDWRNRVFTTQYVLIKKRMGWFRYLAITPGDAENFISQITVSRQEQR